MQPMEHRTVFAGVSTLVLAGMVLFIGFGQTADIGLDPVAFARLYLQTFWQLIAFVAGGILLYWLMVRPSTSRLRMLGLLSLLAHFISQLLHILALFFTDTLLPTLPTGGLSSIPGYFNAMWIIGDVTDLLIPVTALAFIAVCGAALVIKLRGGSTAA